MIIRSCRHKLSAARLYTQTGTKAVALSSDVPLENRFQFEAEPVKAERASSTGVRVFTMAADG